MKYDTDLFYVKVGKTPGWQTVYAYCNGERIDGAYEASVLEGYVKTVDRTIVKGDVSIKYHRENNRPEMDIDLDYDNVTVKDKQGTTVNITHILREIDNYRLLHKD